MGACQSHLVLESWLVTVCRGTSSEYALLLKCWEPGDRQAWFPKGSVSLGLWLQGRVREEGGVLEREGSFHSHRYPARVHPPREAPPG